MEKPIEVNQPLDIKRAVSKLKASIAEASQSFYESLYDEQEEYNDPDWCIENCFLKMLVLLEAVQFLELRKMLSSEYLKIKRSMKGFAKSEMGPDEPYAVHLSRLESYLQAVELFFEDEDIKSITKNLDDILKDIHYIISDENLFGSPPRNENDVHSRIEGILKPVFPDLKHEPTLNKPIKNFKPDTGIPSIRTLIEYKFLDSKKRTSKVAEEILADTRGYISRDWNQFIYVIYETKRFRSEGDWNLLLRESGISNNTKIIVLSGEPSAEKKDSKKMKQMPT